MPGKVEATVEPTTLVVGPGDTAEATATLRNLGQTVDQFTISVEGIDPSWYTLPVSSVALYASDVPGQLRYHLRPESLTVAGGGQSEASLEVRLGWIAFFGGHKELDFQVLARLPEAEEGKTINGQLVRIPWYKTLPQIRLPHIQLPWLTRPPAITTFNATTEDKREFKLSWSTKRATEVKLDTEHVERKGEELVHPTEATSYVLTTSNKYGSTSQTIDVTPLPVPKAKVSERIRASLSPTQLQVQAGGVPLIATLQLQNLGDIVDKFLVEVEGLDQTWYSRSASSVALMPQATDQVQISFQPPKRKGVKARPYPFAVTVSSQSTVEEATSIIGQLEILPLIEFKLRVHPYRVSCRRKGTFRIKIRAIIILALLGWAIYFLIQKGGGWNVLTSNPQTWLNQLIRWLSQIVRTIGALFSR